MSTNWKSLVEKVNAETFVLPDGWDSRDFIAEQLECSPEKVDDLLRPGLKSGRFIKQQHKVWDRNLKRNVMVVAYHDTAADTKPAHVELNQLRQLKANGQSYNQIGKKFGISGDAVRSRLRNAR